MDPPLRNHPLGVAARAWTAPESGHKGPQMGAFDWSAARALFSRHQGDGAGAEAFQGECQMLTLKCVSESCYKLGVKSVRRIEPA